MLQGNQGRRHPTKVGEYWYCTENEENRDSVSTVQTGGNYKSTTVTDEKTRLIKNKSDNP